MVERKIRIEFMHSDMNFDARKRAGERIKRELEEQKQKGQSISLINVFIKYLSPHHTCMECPPVMTSA